MELFEALIASHDNCPQQRRRRISTELQNTRCPRHHRRTVCTLTGQDRGKLRWVLASGHQAVTGPYLIWALNSAPASLYNTQADIYHASSVFMNINVQLLNKASYFKLSTYYLSCYLHISTHGRWSVRPGWAGQGELTGALWPVVAPLPYIEARSQRAVQIFNIDSNV